MDPLTLGLGGLQLIGGLLSSSSARRTAQENLDFQRAEAARQYRLATAGQTDAYGNRLTYNEATNEWTPQLTPAQQALVYGTEREQRLNLTEDAARNRRIRERAEGRGIQAGDAFTDALARYRYEQPPSEDSIRADIMRLIRQGQGEGDRALATMVNRDELRTRGNLPYVLSTGQLSPNAGQRLAQTLLQARQAALQESNTRRQAHNQQYLPAIQEFNQIAGQGSTPINYPTTAQDMNQREQAAIAGVQNALRSGAAGVGSASGLLTQASSKNPFDVKGLLAALRPGKAGKATADDSITPIMSGTRGSNRGRTGSVTMPPIQDETVPGDTLGPWYLSSQSVPSDNWYF